MLCPSSELGGRSRKGDVGNLSCVTGGARGPPYSSSAGAPARRAWPRMQDLWDEGAPQITPKEVEEEVKRRSYLVLIYDILHG